MTKKIWQTALDGRPRVSHHALLWVDAEPVPARHGGDGLSMRPTARRAWPLRAGMRQVEVSTPEPFSGPGELASLLPRLVPRKTGLTVWLAQGWEPLVMSGLAELMESGLYRWRWCTLDGGRVLVRGALGKRRVDITSLACWTGGEWDAWRPHVLPLLKDSVSEERGPRCAETVAAASEDERCALASVISIIDGCRQLRIGAPRLSIGAQARSWWRCWGGPQMRRPATEAKRPGGRHAGGGQYIVPPIPRRPKQAAQAEAHCCHGLIREQYAAGHVGGPVHVLDLRHAYLLGLAIAQLPAVFFDRLTAPAVPALAAAFGTFAGCALVRLSGSPRPYCVRRHDRPVRAVGDYWAWLVGPDVQTALEADCIAECHTAWLWRAHEQGEAKREALMGIGADMEKGGVGHLCPLWRGLYSSLVGGWAQRAWEWVDSDRECRLGRWATWRMRSADGQSVESWRSVAGRVQRQVFRGEAPHALPLAYATITALVREQVDYVRDLLPVGSVLATVCDSLWVTDAGLRAMEEREKGRRVSHTMWRVKDRYDDAWLDGRGSAVVRRGDVLYPQLPGVPAGISMGDDGRARWERAEGWTASQDKRAQKPLRRSRATWDGAALLRANDRPLAWRSPWRTLRQPALPEALLLPYDPLTAAPEDTDDETV